MAAPLLMIPGPTPVSPDVRAALAEPVRSHTSPETGASLRRIGEVIRLCVGSTQARVHVFAGSGTLAMEAALINHAAPGDRVVVCSHGYFGDRFVEIAETLGMVVTAVRAPWGGHVDVAAVREAIASGPAPALVTVTHVDTSTGVLADADALGAAARGSGALLVLDGVCATAGIAQDMDGWGYDVVLTGAQKALGVPPGLAILAVSPRARERRASLGRIGAYYADLTRWDAGIDEPGRYFSTHATSLLRALEVSCDAVVAEGLPQRFERHRRLAGALRSGFARLGFEPLTDTDRLAPTLSALALPPGAEDVALRQGMADHGVLVAAGLGPFAGRGIRVGHMGTVDDDAVARTVAAAAAALGSASP